MAFRLFQSARLDPLLTSETHPRPVKADLRKAESWRELGRAIERVRVMKGLLLKEFAAALDVDERQVARWIKGEERPQIETVYAHRPFRSAIVIALAEQVDGLTIETVVRMAR